MQGSPQWMGTGKRKRTWLQVKRFCICIHCSSAFNSGAPPNCVCGCACSSTTPPAPTPRLLLQQRNYYTDYNALCVPYAAAAAVDDYQKNNSTMPPPISLAQIIIIVVLAHTNLLCLNGTNSGSSLSPPGFGFFFLLFVFSLTAVVAPPQSLLINCTFAIGWWMVAIDLYDCCG